MDNDVPIKNTFVHYKFEMDSDRPQGEGEELVPPRRAISSDARLVTALKEPATSSNGYEILQKIREEQSLKEDSQSSYSHQSSRASSSREKVKSEASFKSQESGSSVLSSSCSSSQASQKPPGVWLTTKKTPKYDPNIISIGAQGHGDGTCRPCAWNWKPEGCSNTGSCSFCHSCGPDELRKRRKDRIAFLKANGEGAEEHEQGQQGQWKASEDGHRSGCTKTSL